jgi:hypothetical protein
MRMPHVRWMVLIAALGFAAACGGEKGEKVVIMTRRINV